MIKNDFNAVIIGAGPTGIFLACLLKENGVNVLLLEKKQTFCEKTKGLMLHARALELLKRIGCQTEVLRHSLIMDALSFYLNDRRVLDLSFKELPTQYPYYVVLPQPVLEKILYSHYTSIGGKCLWETEFTGFTEHANCIEITFKDSVQEHVLKTDFLIGCDGAKSTVRSAAGITFTGSAYPMKYILAEGTLKTPLPKGEASMYISEKGVLSAIPLPDGQFRIAGPGTFEHKEGDILTQEKYERYLKELSFDSKVQFTHYSQIGDYVVSERIASEFCKGRIALAGDAAHIHSPAGGQAITTGFSDAALLSYLLSTKASKEKNIPLEYHEERFRKAQEVIKTTNFFKFINKIKTVQSDDDQKILNNYSNVLVKKLSQLLQYDDLTLEALP